MAGSIYNSSSSSAAALPLFSLRFHSPCSFRDVRVQDALTSAHRVMGVRSARPRGLEVRAGKKKGNKGKSSDNGTQRSASDAKKSVRKGAAYEQETRKTALSMQARSSRPIPPTAGR